MEQLDLTELLGATINPNNNHRQLAEAQLKTMYNIIGFTPDLIQIIMRNDLSLPVRQAGAVCLKNMVSYAWHELEEGEVLDFNIHEQDRARVRDVIVEAVVQAPELLRVHLCLAFKVILECDLPTCWTQVIDKIKLNLSNPNPLNTMGALKCLYSVMEKYEYSGSKKGALEDAMTLLLPILYQIMITLQNNQSVESVLIKKQVLKCYFTLVKISLTYNKEVFSKWMEVLRIILAEPVPAHTLLVDSEQRNNLPWWKLKKWSINILVRLFDRHGSPIRARPRNLSFARWYLFTFTGGILNVLFDILGQYCSRIYVSPLVLQQTLVYICHCVRFSYSWHLLKPKMSMIIRYVLFPILSFSDADQDQWNRNPEQYFNIKNETLQDYVSPFTAAQMLLTSACSKRKGMVEITMDLCMEVLRTPNSDPFQRDGVFHMIGILHTLLMKMPNSNEQISTMLEQYVFPEFYSTLAHMRARACWVVQRFSSFCFRRNVLNQVMQLSSIALLHDSELPVKVEAAIAIQMLLSSQVKAQGCLKPHVREVTTKLLNIICQTGNEKIVNVFQNIVCLYTVQLQPIAYEITDNLTTSFSNVIDSNNGAHLIGTIATALLNALETVVSDLGKSPEILAQIEMTVLCNVVGPILQRRLGDYYQEMSALLINLTAKNISSEMWKILPLLDEVSNSGEDRFEYDLFKDLIPVLFNFITVDTNALLSDETRHLTITCMIKEVIFLEKEDESELYAAKLLEVIVLYCSGRDGNCLMTMNVLSTVSSRVSLEVTKQNMKLMYMQVVVAMFYSQPVRLLPLLNEMRVEFYNDTQEAQDFFTHWITNIGNLAGVHDRKLGVIALCVLLNMGPNRPCIDNFIPMLVPCYITLLGGLMRAYEVQAEEKYGQVAQVVGVRREDVIVSSDEDDHEFMPDEYYGKVSHMGTQTHVHMPVIEEHFELTATERFHTFIDDNDVDEFIIFKTTMEELLGSEPDLYHRLIQINDDEMSQLRTISQYADLRRARRARMFERQRGYRFRVPASLPRIFRFTIQDN